VKLLLQFSTPWFFLPSWSHFPWRTYKGDTCARMKSFVVVCWVFPTLVISCWRL
jgi:hypothetical protein